MDDLGLCGDCNTISPGNLCPTCEPHPAAVPIVASWKPQNLREQYVVTALILGVKEGFGVYLPQKDAVAIIGAAMQRDEPSLMLRLHTNLLTYFAADPIADRPKVEATLVLVHEILADYDARN
jgi:hypothetical protein